MRCGSRFRLASLLALTVGLGCFPFSASLSAQASQACEAEETVGECFRRHEGRVADEESRTADEVQSEAFDAGFSRLAEKLTGLGAVFGPGLATAIGDFLPLFAGAPVISSTDATRVGFAFETNLPFYSQPGAAIQPPNLGGNIQLRAQSRTPEVFGPLLEAVPLDQRANATEILGSGLDQLDDVTLTAVWNAEGAGIGRSFRKHAVMFESLLNSVVAELHDDRPSLIDAIETFADRLDEEGDLLILPDRLGDPDCAAAVDQLSESRFACFTQAFRMELGEAIARSAIEHRNYRAALQERLEQVGFYHVADLLNNQPQLSLSANARLRSDVTGPNTYSLSARYEHGFGSLNSLRGYCPQRSVTIECLETYLAEPRVVAAMRRSDRAWANLEVTFTNDYSYSTTIDGVPVQLQLDNSVAVKGSLGYGRYLRLDANGNESARVDLLVEGELNQADSGKNDRFVASLTYTQKISDDFSLPLGITYANKAEYVGEADQNLGVNIGIRYRLRRDAPERPNTS